MNLFVRLIVTIPTLLISYSLLTGNIQAAGEFQTDYEVTYLVSEDGRATVTQEIRLTNQTTNYYADKFELKIGSVKVTDVKAEDGQGPMETQVKFEDNLTIISVRFNQRVIGLGKTLTWKLTYASGEFATQSGQIWEISIPRLAKDASIANYQAEITVPFSFGTLADAVPNPKKAEIITGKQKFRFDKEQLFESGIAMSFGNKQVFSFNLNYYLENNNLTSQTATITLPPDNNYQRVVLERIVPKPLGIEVDSDNNYLAKYKLSPKQRLEITATGYVEVFSRPFRNIDGQLSNTQKELYTQPQRYWEIDNTTIREKAKQLKTPKQIYDFVANTLTYSEERLQEPKIERKGAVTALATPKDSVCMEFTDLFIALARAAGIPAREVEGYAYTQNERLRPLSLALAGNDILHAWPAYWDNNLGWIQVDPTWGSTSGGLDYFNKLDFNHITFIQRGISSTRPFPAGAYKRETKIGQKSVLISFAQQLPNPTAGPLLSLTVPQKIVAGIPLRVKVKVENGGSSAIIDESLQLSAAKLQNPGQTQNPQKNQQPQYNQRIPILPPYSSQSFEFNLLAKGLFLTTADTLILSYAGNEITQPVKILPIYQIALTFQFTLSVALAVLILAIGFFLYRKIRKSGH